MVGYLQECATVLLNGTVTSSNLSLIFGVSGDCAIRVPDFFGGGAQTDTTTSSEIYQRNLSVVALTMKASITIFPS